MSCCIASFSFSGVSTSITEYIKPTVTLKSNVESIDDLTRHSKTFFINNAVNQVGTMLVINKLGVIFFTVCIMGYHNKVFTYIYLFAMINPTIQYFFNFVSDVFIGVLTHVGSVHK